MKKRLFGEIMDSEIAQWIRKKLALAIFQGEFYEKVAEGGRPKATFETKSAFINKCTARAREREHNWKRNDLKSSQIFLNVTPPSAEWSILHGYFHEWKKMFQSVFVFFCAPQQRGKLWIDSELAL